MFILASLIFGLSFSIYGLMLFPFLLVLFIFGIALGVTGCAVVLRLGPASEWFIWPIPALLSPFVGVLYPLSTLPDWMRLFSWLLPPSYVFDGMRSTISGGAISIGALLWGECWPWSILCAPAPSLCESTSMPCAPAFSPATAPRR